IATQVAQIYRRHGKVQDVADLVTTSSRVLNARVVVVSPRGIRVSDSLKKTPFYRGAWTLRDLSKSALLTGQTFQKQLGPGVYSFQAPVPPVHRQEDGAVVLVVGVADVNPSTATLAGVILIAMGTALVVWLLTGLYF